jgi:hypothetical protein
LPFVVGKDSIGKKLNLGDLDGTGINTSIIFDPVRGAVVIKTIPAAVMQAIKDYARDQRDIYKKGRLIGNTQRHWTPAFSMPIALHEQFKKELGDPKRDPTAARKWRQRINSSEYEKLRTSEYKI